MKPTISKQMPYNEGELILLTSGDIEFKSEINGKIRYELVKEDNGAYYVDTFHGMRKISNAAIAELLSA